MGLCHAKLVRRAERSFLFPFSHKSAEKLMLYYIPCPVKKLDTLLRYNRYSSYCRRQSGDIAATQRQSNPRQTSKRVWLPTG
jgi:hypothetical protein